MARNTETSHRPRHSPLAGSSAPSTKFLLKIPPPSSVRVEPTSKGQQLSSWGAPDLRYSFDVHTRSQRPASLGLSASILSPTMPPVRPLRLAALGISLAVSLWAQPAQPQPLWPGKAPGEIKDLPPESDQTKSTDRPVAGKTVLRLGNVTQPTLTIYSPPSDKNTGAAVLVCPGGGYNILAADLEGTEVCEWLNRLGVTAVLVKYRVPRRPGLEKHLPPLQDAQRALGLVRQSASQLRIDPHRIGVMGFSAGGHLAATLSNQHTARAYEAVDSADVLSCRPDFTLLIYPAYLTEKEKGDAIAPELPISATNTPPTFIAMSADDPVRVETALFYYLALRQAKVPAEMHLYPKGGHGYGLRRNEHDVTTWPDRAADWLKSSGLLSARP